MPRGIPNQRMIMNNRAKKIDAIHLLSPQDAMQMYKANGGHLTEESNFGQDPLAGNQEKFALRHAAFISRYPSFQPIFHEIINGNDALFQEGLSLTPPIDSVVPEFFVIIINCLISVSYVHAYTISYSIYTCIVYLIIATSNVFLLSTLEFNLAYSS